MTLLALDIGGSAVKYGLWHQEELQQTGEFTTPKTRQAFYDKIIELKSETYRTYDINGIALSCPGDTDEETGFVNGFSFVPFLHLGEFQQEFSKTVDLPVRMINDANSATLAELTYGIGKDVKDGLFVIIGTGIGIGMVTDHQLVTTTSDKINDFEKLIADSIKVFNNSKVSLVKIARRVSLKKLKLPSTFNGKDIFELADQGDDLAQKELEQMYVALSHVLISLNAAFKPEMIGIGGGISNNPALIPNLEQHMTEMISENPPFLTILNSLFAVELTDFPLPVLKTCHFKSEANLIGAVIHYQNNCKD